MGERFALRPREPYALAASVRFLEGFASVAYEGGVVVGEIVGDADPGVVRAQVARILSLDIDGSGFPAVGARDPVIGRLQAHYPGLRPVLFSSPYEAAAWALIGHRIRITQAARIKARMAEELGPAVTVHGKRLHAFPSPTRLADLDAVTGLTLQKVKRLRALGVAAADGALDAARLRALPPEEALTQLKALPGIGDFSAQLILLRGAGEPDDLPTAEPRLGRAVARAYGLDHLPSATDLVALAAAWRPYRTWATVLLRAMLEDEPHEITGGARHARGTEPTV